MLFLDAENPEAVIEIATRLNLASDRGRRMIEELMAFARKADTQLVPVEMTNLIRETAQVLQATLPPGVTLHLHLTDNVPPGLADAAQFDRILTNLIINARDAMPEGGRIMISNDVVQFDHVPPGSWQINDAPYFRVMVTDTGVGMDETDPGAHLRAILHDEIGGKGNRPGPLRWSMA